MLLEHVVVDHVESYLMEQNKDGNTPLHLAAEEGHVEVAQILLESCSTSDLEVKNAHGNTPLQLAAEEGHVKVVQLLLDRCQAHWKHIGLGSEECSRKHTTTPRC